MGRAAKGWKKETEEKNNYMLLAMFATRSDGFPVRNGFQRTQFTVVPPPTPHASQCSGVYMCAVAAPGAFFK